MEELTLKGTVVGKTTGKNKAGNPYTLVTCVIGGEPMTLKLDSERGDLSKVRENTAQDLVLSLSAYRTDARVGFLRAA